MLIQFTIPGKPQAWQRARRSKHGGYFVDAQTSSYKNDVACAFIKAVGADWVPVSGALKLSVMAWYPLPRSIPKKQRDKLTPKATRPDIDNIVKGVMDALNKICWYDGSKQILCTGRGARRCADSNNLAKGRLSMSVTQKNTGNLQNVVNFYDRRIADAEKTVEKLRAKRDNYAAKLSERKDLTHQGKPDAEKEKSEVQPAKTDATATPADSDFVQPGVKKSYYNTVVAHENAILTLDNGQRWEVSDPKMLRRALAMDTVKVVLDRDDDPNSWRLWNAVDEEDTTAVEVRPRGQRQKGNQ